MMDLWLLFQSLFPCSSHRAGTCHIVVELERSILCYNRTIVIDQCSFFIV